MKLVFAYVFILFLFTINNLNAKDYEIGVKAGMNINTASGKYIDDIKTDNFKLRYQFGYNVGGLISFNLTEDIYLQVELLYSLLGYNAFLSAQLTTNYFMNIDSKYSQELIDIPILLKFKIIQDFIDIDLFAGPSIGINLRDYQDIDNFLINNVNPSLNSEKTFHNENALNLLNIGLIIGFDYKYSNVIFDAKIRYGLNQLIKDQSKFQQFWQTPNQNRDIKFHSLQFSIGYIVY